MSRTVAPSFFYAGLIEWEEKLFSPQGWDVSHLREALKRRVEMKSRSLRLSRSALVFAALVVFVVCPAVASASPKTEPIKIGLVFAQTGPLAFVENHLLKGGMFLIEKVNREGGINGRPIEPVIYDNESKADLTVTLSKKLILQDKVIAMYGPGITPLHLPAAPLAHEYKVPMVSPGGIISAIPKKYYDYNFVCWADGPINAQGLVYMFRLENRKRIGILGTADPTAQNIPMLEKYMKIVGNVEIVVHEEAPVTATDLTLSLSKIKAKNVDALVVIASGPFATIAMNNTVQVGLDVPIGYIGANMVPELIRDVVPEASKNVRVCMSKLGAYQDLKESDPVKNRIAAIAGEFKARYGVEPNLVNGVGYDTALHLIEALKAVGPDSKKIRDHIENGQKNQLGIMGNYYNMNPEDHMGANIRDHILVNIAGGRFRLVKYMSDISAELKQKGVTLGD